MLKTIRDLVDDFNEFMWHQMTSSVIFFMLGSLFYITAVMFGISIAIALVLLPIVNPLLALVPFTVGLYLMRMD